MAKKGKDKDVDLDKETDDQEDDKETGGKGGGGGSAKGDELVSQAEKKLKSWSLFSSSSKYDDACELYDKAAAQYKIDKEWEKAGQTYVKAAEISEKQKIYMKLLNIT
jgi:hypothetical protein